MKRVGIVDYGIGNLLSVRRAFEHFGAEATLIRTPAELGAADRLVLPGVGAFADGMRGLAARGLVEPIVAYAARERPFLGICLGMQMMFDGSEEFGVHEGLGLIPGRVVAIPPQGIDRKPHRIPHIGWNALVLPPARTDWRGSLLEDVEFGSFVYFVHSFTAVPEREEHRLADCHYGGLVLSAMAQRGTLCGAQFHPEKSGETGLRIIRRFLSW